MKMRQNRRSRILAFLLSAMILVGMLPTAAWAQDGGVTCVTVDITAQRAGVFLMPPQFGVSVSSDLAESYGYTDQVTGGVSALDVAVKAHEILYGDRYTPDTKDAFLAVSSSGTVTRQFEEDTYNTGFYVNNMYPHDGTPAPYGGGYNGYMINQCPVADGDLVEIYTLASDYYADNYTWLLVDGEYTRDITMDVDAGLAVTVEGFYAFNAFICEDIDALIERGNPIEGIHLGVVDLSTGAITPIEGATTDEDGAATLRFSQAGEYIVVAYYTADEIDDMTAAVLTMTRVTVNGPAVQDPVMEITQADLEANGYETYYYCDDIIYTYQGEAVTFISESQIVAGGQTYALKNKKTDITIEEGADGSLTISLSNLSVPVGSIPSAWNSSYGGVVQMVYQTDIPSMAEVRSAASTGAPSSITLTGIPEGTYHLTGGTIYEQANEWSPGYDFGDGMVTSGCFGTLPDITLTVGGEAQQGGYLGVKTQAKVYDDFENDLWLQYQHREMQVGDTASMYPWRVAQIVSNSIANDVYRPNFHFEIISGDSVTLSGETTTDSVTVTAVKPGTSVVKVTYDEVDYNGQHWGAISDVNTGYVVYTVGETGTAVISANEELENWRHYDTIYYNEGETVPYTFTVEAQGAQTVAVTVNGIEIAGDGNRYTADLENRSNIIGIVATDAQGNTKSMYRIIDARFIEVDVENKTRPQQPLAAGDRANIRFRGITMPVYKLATIYNPQMGSNATKVTYENDKLGSFEGKCSQWDLATNNDFDVTFLEAGTYTFRSANGIFCAWWGSPLGTDATMHGSGEPNLGASTLQGYFSVLPDFTVSVADSIAVTSVALNKDKLDMRVGDTEQLSAQVLPTDATHPAVTWSSSDTSVATVADGLVTAVGNGQVQITATADGVQAVCSITVRGVDIQEVNQAIAQLPDADSLTLRDKAAVEAARQLYDDLSQDDQSRVTGYDRLTAAEARLSELMETPFLLSVGGQILPMEKTGEAAGYDGTYYKVTIPENTATVQLERYAQVEVQDGDFNTLVEAGATTVDIDTAGYMGEDHYFTLHHDTFVYHHIYFEIAQEQPPQEDSITVSFTLLGDTAHGEPADEAGTHTLVGNNLETWIPPTTYTVGKDATVRDVFELALTEHGLTWSNPDGNYVTSITRGDVTLAQFTNGSLSGWLFTLNGVHGDLGVNQQRLNDGDVIVFHYTDDFGKEYEAPATAVDQVEALIEALPAVGDLTLEDAADVQKASEAYEALSEEEKASVSEANRDKLQAAVERIEQLQAGEPDPGPGEEPDPGPGDQPDPDPGVDWNVDLDQHLAVLLNNVPEPSVGTTGGEWAVIALARAGYAVPDDYFANYFVRVAEALADGNGILDERKYTEYSRVILALSAIGYDPTDVGGYNLLAMLTDLDKVTWQGVNGPIWALVALDSCHYDVVQNPDASEQLTREKLIDAILEQQLSDGGWALSGNEANADITGMAIQALAPYYDGDAEVKAAVDRALDCLSKIQLASGGFSDAGLTGTGQENAESIAQVIVALVSLGIDPATDSRFVQGDNNPLTALLALQMEEGGFQHIRDGGYDAMATEQSILALIAYDRFANGDTFLYNMSDVTAVANPTVPDPVIEDVTLTDVNGTGVTAAGKENVLKDNMELEANLLTSGDQYDQAAQALGEGKFTLYDLYLLENNLEIQPDGTITLAIPVPEGYDGASCKVYRIGEDGSAAEITAVLKDGKLSFETSLMGMFAVWQPVSVNTGDPDGNGGASHPGAGEEDDSTSHLGANGDTGTPGTGDGGVGTTAPSEGSDGTSNPKTGDASSYVLWLWGLMLSAAMVLLASHKKKQRD